MTIQKDIAMALRGLTMVGLLVSFKVSDIVQAMGPRDSWYSIGSWAVLFVGLGVMGYAYTWVDKHSEHWYSEHKQYCPRHQKAA